METTPAIICYSLGALIVFLGLFERIFLVMGMTTCILIGIGMTFFEEQPLSC